MNAKTPSAIAQLQDVSRRLVELDASDPDLRNKVIALKVRANRALAAPLGNPGINQARKAAIAERRRIAAVFRQQVMPHIEAAKAAGATSFNAMAKYLNENRVPSPQGTRWFSVTVARVIQEPTTNH